MSEAGVHQPHVAGFRELETVSCSFRITVEEGTEVVAGGDGMTYYDGDDYKVELEQLRPRARKILK